MLDNLLKECVEKMAKAIEAVERDLKTLRTGRATVSMLDGVRAVAYGAESPIAAIATISTPDASQITIQPWDSSILPAIEKAIMAANIGLTPSSDGKIIRLRMPQMTEDTRKGIVKKAHEIAEHGRVAVRNVRRAANEDVKKAEKDHKATEDESKKLQEQIQKKTDEHIKKIDEVLAKKEVEIMHV